MRLQPHRDQPSPWAFFADFPRILPYLRPHKRLAGVSLTLVAMSAITTVLSPWPLAIVVDCVLGNKPLPSLLGFLDGPSRYWLLAIAVVGGLAITGLEHGFAVIDNYVNTKLELSMVLDLRSDLLRHIQRLSLPYHDRTKTGQMMFEINNQASGIGRITVAIPPLIQALVTVLGMFVVLVRLDPLLALLSLTVVPPIYISATYYARQIQPRVLDVRHRETQSMTMVHEIISMMRVVVAFGREGHEWRRFRTQAEGALSARVNLTVRQTMFSLIVTMTTATGSALVLGFGAYAVLQHRLTAGELLVAIGYVASLYSPLEQISNTVSGLQQQFTTLRATLNILKTKPEVTERPNARTAFTARGHVVFDNVSFDYPGRKGALTGVSFDAPPGTSVAIVGPTGAGKTTLLMLVPRFYEATSGRVLLDGRDIRDLTLASLRKQISVVLQEPLLFSGTIADNIRYGQLSASQEQIAEAARAANAHDFVEQLPKGYATIVGERGSQLSGGERQRISIARAFLKDAPILILDEPTSAIDSQTEAVILDALERLMVGRTTFLVAHRLSTIAGANLILVVNRGKIVECGSHEALLGLDSLYAQLYDAQNGDSHRRRAAANISTDDLAGLTTAFVAAQESGDGISGPALAALAQALASPERAQDHAWQLLGAAWPLLRDGEPAALRELAASNGNGGEASALARRLLTDLGLPTTLDRT
jgi:ATP-binding cassette subfamily B protein/subfamily B ATP-binding cassette protein MsbA